jgi:hypothetical protein
MSEAYLSSLLDSIDKKTGNYSDVHLVENKKAVVAPIVSSALKADNWAAFPDPTTGVTYYHNFTTNVTQWDKPDGFVELTKAYIQPAAEIPTAATVLQQHQATMNNEYAVKASFNKSRGSFEHTGGDDYWQTVSFSKFYW